MNKLAIALISATAITSVSMAANAQTSQTSAPRFYVTGAAGYAENALTKDNLLIPADQINKDYVNTGFVWKAGLGYQLNPNFAVELNYINLPSVDLKNQGSKHDTTVHEIKSAYDVALMAKAMYPVNQKVDLYAEAGAAYSAYTAGSDFTIGTKTDSTPVKSGAKEHAIVPIVGMGVDYNINDHVSLGVEGLYQVAVKTVPSNYSGTMDIRYNF